MIKIQHVNFRPLSNFASKLFSKSKDKFSFIIPWQLSTCQFASKKFGLIMRKRRKKSSKIIFYSRSGIKLFSKLPSKVLTDRGWFGLSNKSVSNPYFWITRKGTIRHHQAPSGTIRHHQAPSAQILAPSAGCRFLR